MQVPTNTSLPKAKMIAWINDCLKIELTSIEQLGTGAVYCQLLDMAFPGKVPLGRVNWKAKHQHQYLSNLKILVTCMNSLKVDKHIEAEKIAKLKFQDNFELVQWFYKYISTVLKKQQLEAYKPFERRDAVPEFPNKSLPLQTSLKHLSVEKPLPKQVVKDVPKMAPSPFSNVTGKSLQRTKHVENVKPRMRYGLKPSEGLQKPNYLNKTKGPNPVPSHNPHNRRIAPPRNQVLGRPQTSSVPENQKANNPQVLISNTNNSAGNNLEALSQQTQAEVSHLDLPREESSYLKASMQIFSQALDTVHIDKSDNVSGGQIDKHYIPGNKQPYSQSRQFHITKSGTEVHVQVKSQSKNTNDTTTTLQQMTLSSSFPASTVENYPRFGNLDPLTSCDFTRVEKHSGNSTQKQVLKESSPTVQSQVNSTKPVTQSILTSIFGLSQANPFSRSLYSFNSSTDNRTEQ